MSLETTICGLNFKAPLFVAAGPPSRDAEILIDCAKNGCGGLVAKTISVEAAKVARPCMARPAQTLRDTMINVELWSDKAPEEWYKDGGEYDKVKAAAECKDVPLIASLGYSADDVKKLVPHMEPHVDAYEFSCHYTNLDDIRALATALCSATKKPVFAKLSPHGHDLLHLAAELRSCGVAGFVVMNSLGPTLALDVETEQPVLGGPGGKGWMSGQAVRPIALYWVSQLAKAMPDVPIIGVGGVGSWRDAVEFFLAGAWAVEVCTAAIYKGPKVFDEISKGVVDYLKRHGYKNVTELRGRALKNLKEDGNYIPGVSSVDEAKCIHCGQCAASCTYGAITVDSKAKTWKVNPDACYGCGLCTTVCPKGALSLASRK